MCYAIPGKVIELDAQNAVVDFGGVRRKANTGFVDCAVGDFVLVHAGFAIQKVDPDTAKKSWSTLEGL